MNRAAAALLLCLVGVAAPVSAQEVVEPDRPDVTNGPHIVDIGLLQVELGGLFTRASADQRSFGLPVAARVGVTSWLEARAGTDGLLVATEGGTTHAGLGNTQLGAKLRLWADPGGIPVVSILPTITLPTASSEVGIGSGKVDYMVSALTGSDVGRHWHIDANYGYGRIGATGAAGHFAQHLVSASVSVAASDNWNPYAEGFWYSRQEVDGRGVSGIDAGAIYELGARFALDGGVEVTRTGGASQVAAFGGLSMVVGDILGNHGVHARERQLLRRAAARRPR